LLCCRVDGDGTGPPNRRVVGSGSASFGALVPGTAYFIASSALHSLAEFTLRTYVHLMPSADDRARSAVGIDFA
jgi:hypothetical protein